jgi:hypothetical protein
LESKIKPLELAKLKAHKLGHHFTLHDELARLHKKKNELYKIWKFGNYVIAKCGSEI